MFVVDRVHKYLVIEGGGALMLVLKMIFSRDVSCRHDQLGTDIARRYVRVKTACQHLSLRLWKHGHMLRFH